MSVWPSSKAAKVLAALRKIGWIQIRQSGSHKDLSKPNFPNYVFPFHDGAEIGPVMISKIAKHTGLKPEDL